jgi:hypothetical protein
MPSPALVVALESIAAGVAVLRARTPGTPAGDTDDPHEDNTFDLPNGSPIRRSIKRFARRQLKKILGSIPAIGAPLPDRFPLLAPDWNDPMASAMTPILGAYWDEAGKTTRARLGLDPDAWEVHDPHLHEMIQAAALDFCEETNATTDLQLGKALDRLRGELAQGLVEHGESIPELAARVRTVFTRLSTYRAEMIARTEASRAVHAASVQSARESGVVRGKRWLVSANSCDRCVEVARAVNESHPAGVPLDQPFAQEESKNPAYANVAHPPLHPHCRCSITFVLTDEYEQLLAEHPPGSDFEPGPLGPEPKAKAPRERKPREPRPPGPPAWEVGTPIEPARPIGERIAGATHLEAKAKAVRELGHAGRAEIEALGARKDALQKEMQDFVAAMAAEGITDPMEVLKAGLAEIDARFTAVVDDLLKARARNADRIRAGIGPILDLEAGRRAGWNHADGPGFKGKARNVATRREAAAWLESKTARGAAAGPVDVAWHARPRVRAYASKSKSMIMVKADESAGTMVHEMGHHVEYRLPGALKAAQEFLDHRVGSQPLVGLRKQLGGGYRSDEMGRDDDFAKAFGKDNAWYVGKHYSHGSTEIVSMGVELLYNDPVGFAEKDPEYFKFIVGILDGSMRSP